MSFFVVVVCLFGFVYKNNKNLKNNNKATNIYPANKKAVF